MSECYGEAVRSQNPGLLQPFEMGINETRPQRGCGWGQWQSGLAIRGRNPFRVGTFEDLFPGLRQPWALGRNRFAVGPSTKEQRTIYVSRHPLRIPHVAKAPGLHVRRGVDARAGHWRKRRALFGR